VGFKHLSRNHSDNSDQCDCEHSPLGEKLLPSGDHDVAELPPAAIFAMVATIVVKGVIWFGCIRVKTTQVQALAQDCKTVSLQHTSVTISI
jgi:hypothetical protein